MIIFSWTFTPNQIIALRAVLAHQSIDEHWRSLKKNPPDGNPFNDGLRNFFGATRLLFKERLIVMRQVKREPWQTNRTTEMVEKWEVTEKGRIILKLVEHEIVEQQEILGKSMRQLATVNEPRRIKARKSK